MKGHKILLLFLICSCASKLVYLTHYLSTLENIKEFPATEKEAQIIDSLEQKSDELFEKCDWKNQTCIVGYPRLWVEFKGGNSKFREVLFHNFKLPKNAKEGENRIRVIIGNNNNLEKIEILKYTDIETKAAIEEVFKMKELDNWTSAEIYRIPLKTQFEISIFIEKKSFTN